MATKLNAATAKRVKTLGINVKTEEEARKELLKILTSNGIDGMEDEDIETLVEIAESFVEDESEKNPSEEDEADELSEEVTKEEEQPVKKSAKSSKKVEEPDEEDEEEDDEEEGLDLNSMDRTALKKFNKENGLGIKVKKSMSDDDIRKAIVDATKEDDEEDDEEDEKPVPEVKEVKKEIKVEKKAKKPAGKRGTKLDPKNNEEDRKAFEPLKDLFPESEYVYSWVASAGVTIKHKGKNSQRSMVLIENCSAQNDGSIKCNLYLLTFTKSTDILDKADIEYKICWSGAPFIKGITLSEAVEIISGLMEYITATVQKIDKKLGENRKKMEENLDKKSSKKTFKKVVKEPEPDEEEEEDDEEEDEEEEEKPVKKNF